MEEQVFFNLRKFMWQEAKSKGDNDEVIPAELPYDDVFGRTA